MSQNPAHNKAIWDLAGEWAARGGTGYQAPIPEGLLAVQKLEVVLCSVQPVYGGLYIFGRRWRWLGLFNLGPVVAWRAWVRIAGELHWAESGPQFSRQTAIHKAILALIKAL